MSLEFQEYTLEEAQEIDKTLAGSAQFYKIKQGRNIVRFIPAQPGKKWYVSFWRHFINKPDGTSMSFACPARNASQPCPVCEHANRLQNSGSKADSQLAGNFWPGKTYLANVIDREDPDAGPKIIRMGKKIMDQLNSLRKNEDMGGDFSHPLQGFDVNIERTGTTKNDTEYKVQGSRKTSPLGPDEDTMQTWIDTVHELEPFAEIKSFADIQEMMSLDSGSQHQGHSDGGRKALAAADDDEFGEIDDEFAG